MGVGKVGQEVVDIEGGGRLDNVVGVVVGRVDLVAGVIESSTTISSLGERSLVALV